MFKKFRWIFYALGILAFVKRTFSKDKSKELKRIIKETVWVETSVDTDFDGKNDFVKVEIIRPITKNKIPVIFNMSPYRDGLVYPDYYEVDHELQFPKPTFLTKYHYEEYFVNKGYAIVNGSSIGSYGSGGCPTTGDKNELLAAKAVIDWLNGRAEAVDCNGKAVEATWTNGRVGMMGLSYEGTIPNGLATMDVDGLETIVPIGAISNWYDYYRANGAVVAPGGYQGDDADRLARGVLTRKNPEVCTPCMDQIERDQDRETGSYNQFWDERNYLKDAHNIKASVFLVHGLKDMNVKRKQFAQWWELLKYYKVPRKLWLHNGGHVDPQMTDKERWLETLHRWFDYWLYDIENGIMEEDKVSIQTENGEWIHQSEWPGVDIQHRKFYLKPSHHLATRNFNSRKASGSFVDNPFIEVAELIKRPQESKENRLVFLTDKLEVDTRFSGFPKMSIQVQVDQPSANLTAILVDYDGEHPTVVTRGWVSANHVDSIWEPQPLQEDETYILEWELEPHDYLFRKNHQIGLVLLASDYEYTIRPQTKAKVTVFYNRSYIELPVSSYYNTSQQRARTNGI